MFVVSFLFCGGVAMMAQSLLCHISQLTFLYPSCNLRYGRGASIISPSSTSGWISSSSVYPNVRR